MAIKFGKTPIPWKEPGSMPSSELQTNGFQAGYKPAAQTFNAILNNTSECLTELQNQTSNLDDIKAKKDLTNVDNTVFSNKAASAGGTGFKVGKDLSDQTVNVSSDGTTVTTVTARPRAEIFNDYRTRTFDDDGTVTSGNVASGGYAHAQGYCTTASGSASHAQGYGTVASGEQSHAQGCLTTASGMRAHAQGYSTTAGGTAAHSQGYLTTASGEQSHAQGYNTTASASASHAQGHSTTASGSASHAQGYGTVASGVYSHAQGHDTSAIGEDSHAQGYNSKATGVCSHAEGWETEAEGDHSHSEGYSTTASGLASHAQGLGTVASGDYSHSEGNGTKAEGKHSHAEGHNTTASASYSHSEGYLTTASGDASNAGGFCTIANNFQHVHGKFNISSVGATSHTDMSGDIFIIGNGTGENARANALRTTTAGKTYGLSNFAGSGADYAEMWEIEGGNPDGEDWRGFFVTVNANNKISKANSNDYILGAISSTPCVIGDVQSELWHDMYLKDVFGEKLLETVEVEETTDEDGRVIPAHTEKRWILNPEYDPTRKYISRDERPEWATVGLMGKLIVIDDGTCVPGQFCKVADGGIATASGNNEGYRVLERKDENHIRIMFR